ncbi:hypothetical protein H5410_027727 [Solanum commersonii]|uniref:Uncharacterized protein n=1 Tax=Solanum commersonii TaxID=4109 RepID=A0A9J5YZZ3_SOLCO|nr:hypothetical protein H5410_027727 [Solanum commersonii]
MISFCGKVTLISNVLQSVPIHILSTIVPPKYNNKEIGRSKNWAICQNIFFPRAEKGVGFRSLFDISKSMFVKLLWKFRTDNSLWANFMRNKYYKKEISILVQGKGGSYLLKIMQENTKKNGEQYVIVSLDLKMKDIRELMNKKGWDSKKLQQALSERIINHVQEYLSNFNKIWCNKTSLAILFSKWDNNVSTNCLCCIVPSPKTIQHSLLIGEIAIETFGTLALVWTCTSLRSESTRLEDVGSRGPEKMLVRRRLVFYNYFMVFMKKKKYHFTWRPTNELALNCRGSMKLGTKFYFLLFKKLFKRYWTGEREKTSSFYQSFCRSSRNKERHSTQS